MPPPPVAGAAVGNGLAEGLGVGDAEGLGVGDAEGLGVADGDSGGVAVADAEAGTLAPAEPVAVPLAETAGVGEPGLAGENEVAGAPADGVEPEQPETAAEKRTAMMLHPMRASRALSPARAMAVRSIMQPPDASCRPIFQAGTCHKSNARGQQRHAIPHPP